MEIHKNVSEYLDIYDENGNTTGNRIIRGAPIKSGEYSLSVHLFIYNSKGMFLIQKRAKNKRSLPGIWSATCGAVSAGESSIEAGIREAKEELGLTLKAEEFEFIQKIKRRHSFIDMFFVKTQFDISKCILQREEVDAIKLSYPKELINLVNSSPNVNSSYSAAIIKAMKDRGLM